jgi:hypothetical protein
MSTKIPCPGSGERSNRIHSSGALMCPSCNGAYLSAGATLPEHECEVETPTDLELLLGAIARGWCHPENAHKVMDEELAEAIADEVLPMLVLIRSERDRYSEALEDIVQFEHEEMGREGHVWAVARRALNPQGHSDPSTDSEAVDSPQDPDLLSSEATAIRDAYPQAYLLGPIPFGELPQEESDG